VLLKCTVRTLRATQRGPPG